MRAKTKNKILGKDDGFMAKVDMKQLNKKVTMKVTRKEGNKVEGYTDIGTNLFVHISSPTLLAYRGY